MSHTTQPPIAFMPLKLFATKEEIPAEQQGEAIELKDGKFAIVEESDTSGLTSAIESERTKREAAEKLAKKAADELKKLQTRTAAGDAGVTAEKLAEIEKQVEERIVEKYKPQIDAAEAYAKENRTLKLDAQVKTLAGKCGVIGAEMENWWGLHGSKFDLTSDGKPVVKGKEGAALDKFISDELKKATPYFYEGTKAAGGGAAGVTNGGGGASTMTADDVLKNPGAALQAARAAGKTE